MRPRELLLDELDEAARQLVGATAKAVGQVGLDRRLSLSQYRALVLAMNRPGVSIRDVSSSLDIAPSSATRLCQRLMDRKLMVATPSEQDGRLVALSLTREGNRIVRSVTTARRRILNRVVREAGVDPSDGVCEALHNLNTALDSLDREVLA